jgi:hypothetical protein
MFTWIENTEKPTRLTGKPKEKNVKTSHITSSSFQTATTSVKTSISSTLAYDFCVVESFAAETNLRASGYEIFFSDFSE